MLDITLTHSEDMRFKDDMASLTRMLEHCIAAHPGHFVSKIHTGKSGPYYRAELASHISSDAVRVGEIASLVAFERDGEKWRYSCEKGSREASAVLTRMHAIRYALHDRQKDIALRHVSATSKKMTIDRSAAREIALMSLALDAISDPTLRRDVVIISGIDRLSEDAQGDAQYACENYDEHISNIAQ